MLICQGARGTVGVQSFPWVFNLWKHAGPKLPPTKTLPLFILSYIMTLSPLQSTRVSSGCWLGVRRKIEGPAGRDGLRKICHCHIDGPEIHPHTGEDAVVQLLSPLILILWQLHLFYLPISRGIPNQHTLFLILNECHTYLRVTFIWFSVMSGVVVLKQWVCSIKWTKECNGQQKAANYDPYLCFWLDSNQVFLNITKYLLSKPN